MINVRILELDWKHTSIIAMKIILVLVIPYSINCMNWNYGFHSIIFQLSIYMNESIYIFQLFPDVEILFPALLILSTCILWGIMANRLSKKSLLKSFVFVILILIVILLIFLPWYYALFPIPGYGYIAVVPRFVDLVPFAGLVFTIFVYVPFLIRCVIPNETNLDSISRKAVLYGLIAVGIFLPKMVELWTWASSDWQHHFGQGIDLYASTWIMSHNIDGNLWGQNESLGFSIISIPKIILWGIISIPCFIFIHYVLLIMSGEKKELQLFATGFIQTLLWFGLAVWNGLVTTHAGTSVYIPCPCLILTGIAIIITHHIARKKSNVLSEPQSIEADLPII